jgi:hypothetical protein
MPDVKDQEELVLITTTGLVVYVVLIAVALWRSWVLYKACGLLPFTARKLFHLCMVILATFKVIE